MREKGRGDLYTTNTPTHPSFLYTCFFFVENNVHLSPRGVRDICMNSMQTPTCSPPRTTNQQREKTCYIREMQPQTWWAIWHCMKLCVYDLSLEHCRRSDRMLLVHVSSLLHPNVNSQSILSWWGNFCYKWQCCMSLRFQDLPSPTIRATYIPFLFSL